jgi:hypothetical protein
MKHLNKILVAVMMVMGLSLTHKTVTTLGQSRVNAVDTELVLVENGWLNHIFSTIRC